nr:hypothetical protein [Bacteroidota bacterium]
MIYGYSYGGILAVKLTKALEEKNIQVVLLVTVDAALGPLSKDYVDRNIPGNVKQNINFFESNSPNNKAKAFIGSNGLCKFE